MLNRLPERARPDGPLTDREMEEQLLAAIIMRPATIDEVGQ
jgi:hypothetical protein